MTRNLKALGLALLAVFALGAIGAQAASAADAHQFHSDGEKTIVTGENEGAHVFQVGAVGTVSCANVKYEGTNEGTFVGPDTWEIDEVTIKPTYTNCTFGGQAAAVFFNDCAFISDSDTTAGNSTGGKHAKVTIECSGGSKIQVHTVNCTITAGAQEIPDAVRYENSGASANKSIITIHNMVTGKERSTAAQPVNGCLTFPSGAIGKYTGNAINKCFKDEDLTTQTNPTTPGPTKDETTTACTITDI